jgi:hypothetical protein
MWGFPEKATLFKSTAGRCNQSTLSKLKSSSNPSDRSTAVSFPASGDDACGGAGGAAAGLHRHVCPSAGPSAQRRAVPAPAGALPQTAEPSVRAAGSAPAARPRRHHHRRLIGSPLDAAEATLVPAPRVSRVGRSGDDDVFRLRFLL